MRIVSVMILNTLCALKTSSALIAKQYYRHNHQLSILSSSSSSSPSPSSLSSMSDFVLSDTDKDSLLTKVYRGGNVFVLTLAGGGASSVAEILNVPGASKSIMEITIPYSRVAMAQVVPSMQEDAADGGVGVQICSLEMAQRLARAARQRCIELTLAKSRNFAALGEDNIFGVGCTASLASGPGKKGSHRCHVAVAGLRSGKTYSAVFDGMGLSRRQEDQLCTQLVLRAVLDASGVPSPAELAPPETTYGKALFGAALDDLYAGRAKKVVFARKGSGELESVSDVQLPKGIIVYSGSFNPLHKGHVELIVASMRSRGWTPSSSEPNPMVVFEMAAINADKPPLAREEVHSRLKQFDAQSELFRQYNITNFAVCVTSEPLFVGKSGLFRECSFVIGADTLTRLIDPKYYGSGGRDGDSTAVLGLVSALMEICSNGCSFVVGGRRSDGSSTFDTMEGVFARSAAGAALPARLCGIFSGLAEAEFRVDLSSTALRRGGQ